MMRVGDKSGLVKVGHGKWQQRRRGRRESKCAARGGSAESAGKVDGGGAS